MAHKSKSADWAANLYIAKTYVTGLPWRYMDRPEPGQQDYVPRPKAEPPSDDKPKVRRVEYGRRAA